MVSYMGLWGVAIGPSFCFCIGLCLSQERYVAQVWQAIGLAGVKPGGYLGHSFCIEAASSAPQSGVQDFYDLNAQKIGVCRVPTLYSDTEGDCFLLLKQWCCSNECCDFVFSCCTGYIFGYAFD